MPRLFKIILLVCFLMVPSTVLLTEDDPDYFPAEFVCYDSGFNVAAQLHWITEELKKNAPYEIGYPLLYSTLVFLPLIPFLCFLIPSKESLVRQFEEEQKRSQMEEELEKNDEHEEEHDVPAQEDHHVPAQEPCATIISRSFIRSKSISSTGVGLLAAVDEYEPELRAPRVVMEITLTEMKEEGQVTVAEQSPDLTMVNTADSFVRIKKLAEKMCPESTLGKTCAMVAAGALISYGIYHLFSK